MTEQKAPHAVATAEPDRETAVVAQPRVSLLARIASRYNVDPKKLNSTLKATAFRQSGGDHKQVTDEQMMALLVVADQYQLNPFTKEIYAFPDPGRGIVPIVGVDGWHRIINTHPDFDGMEFVVPDVATQPEHWQTWQSLDSAKTAPDWIECVIYRRDRSHPIRAREYLDECYRPPSVTERGKRNGPWQSHTKRMLRHKALIQCARMAFSFAGVYDEDEAERIIEGEVVVEAGGTSAETEALVESLRERVDAMERERPETPQEAPEDAETPETTAEGTSEAPRAAQAPESDDSPPDLARLVAWVADAPDSSALAGILAQAGHLPRAQLEELVEAINDRDAELRGKSTPEKPNGRGRSRTKDDAPQQQELNDMALKSARTGK